MQKIIPFLWYDHEGEEAARFYVKVFSKYFSDNSSLGRITHYNKEMSEAAGRPAGSVMTVEFTLAGQDFVALNGGAPFKLSEAVSFAIICDNQEELDYYWNSLKEGGDEKSQVCGWLKDKFGLSWQVTPRILNQYMADPDPEKSRRVMQAMLKMKKIDISELEKAAAGK